MRRKPTAVEILNIVIDLMRSSIIPALAGREAFRARVIVNALGIVAREFESGPQADHAACHTLSALLGQSDLTLDELLRETCRQIDQEELTLATPGLLQSLRELTMDSVAIDQPSYSTYRRIKAERSD